MKLGTVMIAFLPRLLIALAVFVVVVCAAACAGMIEMLSSLHSSRAVSIDVTTSSLDRGRFV